MGENQSMNIPVQTRDLQMGGFFGALARRQSYLNIAYLVLSGPLGIAYFVFLCAGLSLGLGLAIVVIGLLILLVMLVAVRALASWERQLSIWILGARIPPPVPNPPMWQHPLMTFKKYITDSYIWKSLIYLLLKFPLAIINFCMVLCLGCTTIALIFTPFYYRYAPVHFFFWRVVRGEEALVCMAVGLVLGLLSIHVLNGLAAVNRAFATVMLSGPAPSPDRPRTGPIIIP